MTPYEQAYALMEEIYQNFTRLDKLWFLGEEASSMHSTLGRHLRNHANLWQNTWEPELVDSVDHSPSHPDAISARVIRDFQTLARKQEAQVRNAEDD